MFSERSGHSEHKRVINFIPSFKLTKIIENLYREDQISLLSTSKIYNQFKFDLFSSIAFEYLYLRINN